MLVEVPIQIRADRGHSLPVNHTPESSESADVSLLSDELSFGLYADCTKTLTRVLESEMLWGSAPIPEMIEHYIYFLVFRCDTISAGFTVQRGNQDLRKTIP